MWRQCDYELRLVVIQYAKRSPLETFWAKRTTLRCGLQQAMPRPLRRFGVRRVLLSRREATSDSSYASIRNRWLDFCSRLTGVEFPS
jgi:hypothetical protein